MIESEDSDVIERSYVTCTMEAKQNKGVTQARWFGCLPIMVKNYILFLLLCVNFPKFWRC